MPVSPEFRQQMEEVLGQHTTVTSRSMFGGVGIYGDGFIFCVLDDDRIYFKVDDSNRGDFEEMGMGPFIVPGMGAMQYYEVPPSVLTNADELGVWVDKAIAVSERAKKGKKK